MGITKIEWADHSWNPITGCSPVSEGCQNCYAKRMAYRLKGRYGYLKDDPFRVTFHSDRLEEPLYWKKPSRIFVCSMGDLFHAEVKHEWIDKIWEIMAFCHQHTFLILTKRPQNIESMLYGSSQIVCRELGGGDYLPNLWLGVSVENQRTADERISVLLQIPAAKRFVSVEPMLSEIDLLPYLNPYSKRLDQIICGCESGPKRRMTEINWVRNLRDQCRHVEIPFFLKQIEINWKVVKMPKLDGCEWNKFPK